MAMSDEGDGLPVVRVKFACASAEEFRRKFEANLLAKGMLARTPQMHEVGRRVILRLELQDGSFGVDEEAVVQALEWTGGKQAMRLQLVRTKERAEPTSAPPVAPSPAAAAPASSAVPLPAPPAPAAPARVPTAAAVPVTEWPKHAERSRTDTETTRAMSLDELLNALPPTAKPKLTPSGGVPHLNGADARPPPPAAASPAEPPPPLVRPMTPVYPMAAYRAEPPGMGHPAFAPVPAPVPASVSTTVTQPGSIPLAAQPPPVTQPWETSPPPPMPSAPPSYAMTMAPFAAPAPAPEPAPPPLDSVQATVISTGNGVSRSSAAIDLSDSIQEAIRPAEDEAPASFTSATTAVNPATSAVTASNPATSAVTASNATVAVDQLADQVQKAKRRGAGGAIATVLLLLAVASGAGAYLWRTGQLEALAPALAARLPPSPASVTTAPPAPAPTPAPTPEPVAAAPTPPAPPAPAPTAAPAEPPKPETPVAAAPPTPEPEAPKPPPAPAEPEAPKAKLTLHSTPPGAKVAADGQQVGVTPMELDWPSGKPIKLKLSKPGFKSVTRAFTPKVNGTLDVELTAEVQENELKDVY